MSIQELNLLRSCLFASRFVDVRGNYLFIFDWYNFRQVFLIDDFSRVLRSAASVMTRNWTTAAVSMMAAANNHFLHFLFNGFLLFSSLLCLLNLKYPSGLFDWRFCCSIEFFDRSATIVVITRSQQKMTTAVSKIVAAAIMILLHVFSYWYLILSSGWFIL